MSAIYYVGDVFDTLATLPDDSVDLIFSSPPFLALRSYLPADHPLKDREIGSEATPADFLDTLLDVVEACDRVLAPHGSLCFELGDSFSGSGGAGGDYAEDGLRDGQSMFDGTAARARAAGEQPRPVLTRTRNPDVGWPLAKSLCGIPTLFAWSLAYGRNLLRPERTTPRWRIRNIIVWCRPNPPVGALGDKMRPATSYLTVACKSDKRWFDLDAVRTDGGKGHSADAPISQSQQWKQNAGSTDKRADGGDRRGFHLHQGDPAGAPPLDYWEIPTHPYKNSHYATFPPALCVKPIASMCPSSVCRTCGEPRRRLTDVTYDNTDPSAWGGRAEWSTPRPDAAQQQASRAGARAADAGVNPTAQSFAHGRAAKVVTTTGWTDCGHNDYRTGCVLDPFAGSGTTLAVATGHGRDAIGIDLDARNAELALERVGPLFLSVETLEGTEPFSPPAEDVETEIV